jgi:hypothetical protein
MIRPSNSSDLLRSMATVLMKWLLMAILIENPTIDLKLEFSRADLPCKIIERSLSLPELFIQLARIPDVILAPIPPLHGRLRSIFHHW